MDVTEMQKIINACADDMPIDATAGQIRALIGEAILNTKREIKQQLTHELNTYEMLKGWEKHWVDVGDGRYVQNCLECENSTKIIKALNPQERQVV